MMPTVISILNKAGLPSPDGLINVDEFNYNSNPLLDATDSDGFNDKYEVGNKRSPTVNEATNIDTWFVRRNVWVRLK